MANTVSGLDIKRGLLAISPIIVFLIVYLATSIIIGDFYKMPLSVAFLISSTWAMFTLRKMPLNDRIADFSKGAGSSNVLYMVWIFILAGVFAALAKETGAVEATVNLTLKILPPFLIVPGLFVATCFISMAIGTSVGTVVALVPLAVDLAQSVNSPVPFFVAIVLGGAFFGDNLSFISDTTIAATRTQGCDMKDKFLANIKIVVPAALISMLLYCIATPEISEHISSADSPVWLILPYLLVIVLALAGVNVTIVLLAGIISAIISALFLGCGLMHIAGVAGQGIDSVGDLIVITLLAAGMLGVIKSNGGLQFIMDCLRKNIHGKRGAQGAIAALVGIVNICTANNTVAILTVGPIVKQISTQYGITPKKTASLLDTGSCIVQALIPYGAQTLMAASLAGISPIAPWPYLFYPQILILCLIVSILVKRK